MITNNNSRKHWVKVSGVGSMGYNIWRSFWTNTVPAPIIITIFVRCHNKKYFFSHQVLDPFMLRTNFICYPKLFLQHHSSGDLFPFYASKHLTKYCIRWTFCTPNSATNNAWARIDSRNYAVAHDHEFRLKYYYRSLYIYNMRCVRYQWTDFHDFFFFLVTETTEKFKKNYKRIWNSNESGTKIYWLFVCKNICSEKFNMTLSRLLNCVATNKIF